MVEVATRPGQEMVYGPAVNPKVLVGLIGVMRHDEISDRWGREFLKNPARAMQLIRYELPLINSNGINDKREIEDERYNYFYVRGELACLERLSKGDYDGALEKAKKFELPANVVKGIQDLMYLSGYKPWVYLDLW